MNPLCMMSFNKQPESILYIQNRKQQVVLNILFYYSFHYISFITFHSHLKQQQQQQK